MGVYVDDLLCLGSNFNILDWLYTSPSESYTLTSTDPIHPFLGMSIIRDVIINISLSLPGYISSMIERFNINKTNPKPPSTPISSKLWEADGIPLTRAQQQLYTTVCNLSVLFYIYLSEPVLILLMPLVN
jgi:Reverse transcriptase (RNA-dependent DNA polymerase)